MKNNDCFRLKDSQSGMALIEVLVAMLVLTIGILALLSVQLRTVASVREAETQTIVSQITQNLMEGMLMNPTIDSDSNKKNYNLYMGNHTLSAVDGDFAIDAIKTKAQLAEEQLKRFSYELKMPCRMRQPSITPSARIRWVLRRHCPPAVLFLKIAMVVQMGIL